MALGRAANFVSFVHPHKLGLGPPWRSIGHMVIISRETWNQAHISKPGRLKSKNSKNLRIADIQRPLSDAHEPYDPYMTRRTQERPQNHLSENRDIRRITSVISMTLMTAVTPHAVSQQSVQHRYLHDWTGYCVQHNRESSARGC
jgi:hypothetical protein